MIITVFARGDRVERSILTANLAGISATNHQKVAVIDVTAPQYVLSWSMLRKEHNIKPKIPVFGCLGLREDLENPFSYLRRHYRDIFIDTDGVDRLNADSALVASHLLILPLWSHDAGNGAQDEVIHRLKEVRLFNPGMRILIVRMESVSASGTAQENVALAAGFANRIPGALLADTVLHGRLNPRRAFDLGLTMFEDEMVSDSAAAELRRLHQEIAETHKSPSARGTAELSEAILEHVRGR